MPNSNVLMLVKPLNGLELYEKSLQFFAFQTTLVKPLQPQNVLSPIEVTELPMVTLVKPLQPENAYPPIEVTELPMVTLVKPVHL